MASGKPLLVYFGLLVLIIVLTTIVSCDAQDSKKEVAKESLGAMITEAGKTVDNFTPSNWNYPKYKSN